MDGEELKLKLSNELEVAYVGVRVRSERNSPYYCADWPSKSCGWTMYKQLPGWRWSDSNMPAACHWKSIESSSCLRAPLFQFLGIKSGLQPSILSAISQGHSSWLSKLKLIGLESESQALRLFESAFFIRLKE